MKPQPNHLADAQNHQKVISRIRVMDVIVGRRPIGGSGLSRADETPKHVLPIFNSAFPLSVTTIIIILQTHNLRCLELSL